jgi:hypothetical protein
MTDVRLRTPEDGQKWLPETCGVIIPTKVEFSASVGCIHKDCYDARSYDRRLLLVSLYP